MEYTGLKLFQVAAFEVKALVASIVPYLKPEVLSKLITPFVRKLAILFPLITVLVTFMNDHSIHQPVIRMNTKEPEVNSFARFPKFRHLLDCLAVHVPEETHPRGEALCVAFVLVIKARGDHEEVADNEDTGDSTVFLVQSHHAEPVGRAVLHPVVHKLQPVNVFGLHVRSYLLKKGGLLGITEYEI